MNLYDMSETPGLFYAISYWAGCILFISVNEKKIKGFKYFFVQLMSFILLYSYMEIFNSEVPQMYFIPSMFIVILILFFQIYLSSDFSKKNAGYYTARTFIVGEFTASFVYQIYYYAVTQSKVPFTYVSMYLFILVLYSTIFFIMYLLEKKYMDENKSLIVTGVDVLSVSIIAMVIFIISNLSYVYQNTPFSGNVTHDIFNIRTLVDLGGVAFLFAYHMQINELKMKFEVGKLHNLLKLQIANYEMSERSIEMVNQKYHDLKHQLSILKNESVTKESYDYLVQMEDEIKVYEAQNKTGNKILDTVLMGKNLYCQGENINLTSVANGGALNFMDTIDISILFGNILDNAIESVKKIEDIEKRLIHLTVSTQKNFLRIQAENCFEGENKYLNGFPITTKQNKMDHGYGLKSIQSTVKKYGGSMTINEKKEWFEIRILIPLPKM